MVIEIVDFPIKNGWIFYSYVNVYQRESGSIRTFADWIRGVNVCRRMFFCSPRYQGPTPNDRLMIDASKDIPGLVNVYKKLWKITIFYG